MFRMKTGGGTWTPELAPPERLGRAEGCGGWKQQEEHLDHFIYECERYKHLRENTIDKCNNDEKNEMLKKAMNNDKVFKSLSEYIERAY